MDFGLTDDQREIQRTARDLLAGRASAEVVRSHAEAGTTDASLWRELSELGWPGIAIGEAHGGQGLGAVELAILSEELGRSLAPVPFLPSVAAASVIEHGGSAEQAQRWLPGLASGETVGALAMSSSDGVAELVLGGREAGVFVLVEEDGGARLLAREEVELTPLQSIDPTRSAARVSAGEGAGEALAGELDRALVAVSAELVGVCARALEMTVAYVKERKQFGKAIGTFQALRHRIADLATELECARLLTYEVAERLEQGADPVTTRMTSMAKIKSSEVAKRIALEGMQMMGGYGYATEYDMESHVRHSLVLPIYAGTNEIQREIISGSLGLR